ncbi:MAG: PDZ domain-containing protein [Planctomycetota bacterium JB042]
MKQVNGRMLILGAVPALLLLLGWPEARSEGETVRAKDVATLIESLGSDSGFERDEAFDELARRGEEVRGALENAASTKDPRVKDAVDRLLERLETADADGGLRLKDRFGRPDADGPPMPAFPRLRPFPFAGGEGDAEETDLDAWHRQWNSEIEEWNRQLDAWMKGMVQGGGALGGGLGAAPGAQGSFRTFRSGEEGSTGYELKVDRDGHVTARITRERDGERTEETVEADSMEQFKAEYPEVAKGLGLDFDVFGGPGSGLGLRFGPDLGGLRLRTPRPIQPWSDPGSALRRVGGPRLGVSVRVIEEGDPLRAHVALDPGIGLLVEAVVPGSLADELDVRRNDILLEVGGVEVGSPADVRAGLEKVEADAVEVEVIREGTRRVLRRNV